MEFCWTTIRVTDIDASLRFYRDLAGLELVHRASPQEGIELAFLGTGETQLELIGDSRLPAPAHGSDISVGFRTESLDRLIELLAEAEIAVEAGPFEPTPRIRFLYVRDPDGAKVQFVENR